MPAQQAIRELLRASFRFRWIQSQDMPVLHLETRGHVTGEEVQNVLSLLEECYGHLRPEDLDLVEVLLFENDRMWRSHVAAERRKAGVRSAPFEDTFTAAHDAWTGIPRICISLERRQALTPLVWEGVVHHEVGHSILHGTLEYYVFPTPIAFVKAAQEFPALAVHLTDLLYLLALAVKDMEVTRLLVSNRYIVDQAAYARFVMKPAQEDLDAWVLSSVSAEARVLCLSGKLKDIAPATVLASRPESCQMSVEEVEEALRYLPQELRLAVSETMTKTLENLSNDTFSNIQTAAAHTYARIIEPVMRARSTK